MSRREKILGAVVAAMVLLWGGSIGLDRYRAAQSSNEELELNTQMELSRAKTASLRGQRAQRLLTNWRKQSLPSNIDVAKTLYQDWLRNQLDESFMIVKEIREQSPRASRQNYQQVTFVVTATGSLSKLTEFLYRFYEANHLHRISEASIVPTSSRKSLTVTLRVDALVLPDCKRTDQLAEGERDTFEDSLDDIDTELKSRNIFLVYEPPQPPEPEPGPEAEAEPDPEVVADTPDTEAASAFFSSITRGAAGWRMSIRMNDSGRMLYFSTGDRIEIGRFSGTIVELSSRRVVLEDNEGRKELSLGQNLSQLRALPAPPVGEDSLRAPSDPASSEG